jgi:hypothetical protein
LGFTSIGYEFGAEPLRYAATKPEAGKWQGVILRIPVLWNIRNKPILTGALQILARSSKLSAQGNSDVVLSS